MAKQKTKSTASKGVSKEKITTKEQPPVKAVPRLVGNDPVTFVGNGTNRWLKRKKKVLPASQAQRFIDKGYGTVINE